MRPARPQNKQKPKAPRVPVGKKVHFEFGEHKILGQVGWTMLIEDDSGDRYAVNVRRHPDLGGRL